MKAALQQPPVVPQSSSPRWRFRREIRKLAREAGVRCVERQNLLIQRLVYPEASKSAIAFVAAVNAEGLQRLRPRLDESDCTAELSGSHVDALWFERRGRAGLFFAPHQRFCSLDQSVLNANAENRVVAELREMGTRSGIRILADMEYGSCEGIRAAFGQYIQKACGLSFNSIGYVRHHNSQKEIERWYRNYCRGVFPQDYGNAECFGRAYYWNVKVMHDVFGAAGNSISLHDVGTNLGHLPLLLARLGPDDLMGLSISRIVASDVSPRSPRRMIRRVLRREGIPAKRVDVIRLDLLNGLDRMPDTDVITANDVLEHFSEATSWEILQGLWSRTKKLLMVHVPIEDPPDRQFGHRVSFNADKIRRWASQLPSGTFLSDRYRENGGELLPHYGYLFMVK